MLSQTEQPALKISILRFVLVIVLTICHKINLRYLIVDCIKDRTIARWAPPWAPGDQNVKRFADFPQFVDLALDFPALDCRAFTNIAALRSTIGFEV